MLAYHKEMNADCTIAVMEVPMEEASRFGILNTNEDGSIYEFEEKPKKPKSNLASMGIYMFSWNKLRRFLEEDEKDPKSSNDFGKNVLPAMLADGQRMFAWRFDGYWKDVGTIDSLWEANMDLLNPKVDLDLSDPAWKIYARNPELPPQYVGATAEIENSMVTEGAMIYGKIDFSILFSDVYIAPGAVVRDSIIMPGAKIMEDAVVQYAIIGEGAVIGQGAIVGGRPEESTNLDEWGVAVVGEQLAVGAGAVVPPKVMIDQDIKEAEK